MTGLKRFWSYEDPVEAGRGSGQESVPPEDRKDPAFHCTDIAIPGAEISGQGDDA